MLLDELTTGLDAKARRSEGHQAGQRHRFDHLFSDADLFWHNPADWSYAWCCRTLHNPCCMLLPLGISIHEDLGDGVYQVYVEIDGKLVPYVAVDSATGDYHG